MLKRLLIGTAATLTITAGQALAGSPFGAMYSFGDSLSDVGNVYIATGGTKPANPYINGQFSNGQVWVQDLAARLGLPALTPSLAGGSDYAFGGATTGSAYTNNSAVPDLEQQVAFFLGHSSAPSNALFTFSIGANDLFAILHGSTGGLTPLQAAAAAAQVVASEAGDLEVAGAKDLVLFDVPDLGVTPGIKLLGPTFSAEATALSAYFDQQVLLDLAPVEADGLTVFDLNTYALIDDVVNDPTKFGFSNVTAPCWTGAFTGYATGGSICSTLPAVQDKYLFWDDVHPTAAGHLLVADAALSAMGLPVPEPSIWAMMLVGFAGLGFAGYRKSLKAVTIAA